MSTDSCVICGRRIKVQWWQFLTRWTCSDREECIRVADQDANGETVYLDYEEEPHDIWRCSLCLGRKEVAVSQDWESGALNIERCPACEGTGVQLGYKEPA